MPEKLIERVNCCPICGTDPSERCVRMAIAYVADENCLIEWESNGLGCVSTTAIKNLILDLEEEMAKRYGIGAIVGKWPSSETDEVIEGSLAGLNPEKKLIEALEKIARFRDSNDCSCICWGVTTGIEDKCPMCIARETLASA